MGMVNRSTGLEGDDGNAIAVLLKHSFGLIERLHRLQLDLIKDEFERLKIRDINPVQALILFNVSHRELTAGELRKKGFYQGSNVSYNLKKLIEMDYMSQRKSETDGRAVHVRLTEKGRQVESVIAKTFRKHGERMIALDLIDLDALGAMAANLERIEDYLQKQIRFIY